MKKKVYLIGGRPELVVYGDINPVFAATELQSLSGRFLEPENDAIRIFFLGGALADRTPLEIPSTSLTVFEGSDVCLKADGARRFGEWYGRARTVVDPEKKMAVIILPGLRGLNMDFVSRFIFRPILDTLLYESGYFPLHAGGVVSPAGGCIITGPAGSGKSSLIAGLMENGFGFMADDRILIRRDETGSLCMCAFPEYLRIAVSAHGPKRLIAPPVAVQEKAPVKYIFLLPGENAVNPVAVSRKKYLSLNAISGAEAAARLMHSVSSNLNFSLLWPEKNTLHKRVFKLIGDLCISARVYVLSGWGEPRGLVRKVTDLLNEGESG